MANTTQFRECGYNVTLNDPVVTIRPGSMVFRNNIIVDSFSCLNGGYGLYVGNHVEMSFYVSIIGRGFCILEDFVTLAAGCRVINGSEDIVGSGLTNPTIPDQYRSYYRSFVHVKKHAFLGTRVIVHPGVTIGEGAVVGSGSVVTTSLEPWGVYMGQPARWVRERPCDRILDLERRCLEEEQLVASDFSQVRKEIDRVFDGTRLVLTEELS